MLTRFETEEVAVLIAAELVNTERKTKMGQAVAIMDMLLDAGYQIETLDPGPDIGEQAIANALKWDPR